SPLLSCTFSCKCSNVDVGFCFCTEALEAEEGVLPSDFFKLALIFINPSSDSSGNNLGVWPFVGKFFGVDGGVFVSGFFKVPLPFMPTNTVGLGISPKGGALGISLAIGATSPPDASIIDCSIAI